MKRLTLILLGSTVLVPACAMPGDAAWSDLHANGFVGLYDVSASGDALLDVTDGTNNIDGKLVVNEDSDSATFYGVRAGFAPLELVFSGFDMKTVSGGTFTGSFDDGGPGGPINGTANATTTFDIEVQKIMLGIDVLNTPVARVGLLIGVDLITFNTFNVTATQGALSATFDVADDEQAPVPIVGVRGDVALPAGFRVGGEATGVSADVDDIDVTFLDFDAHVGYSPFDNEWVELLLGYRAISFEFDGELDGTNIDGEFDFDGLYWAVGITF